MIGVLVNLNHVKFQSIRRMKEVNDGPWRRHVMRSNKEVLHKQHRLLEELEKNARKR